MARTAKERLEYCQDWHKRLVNQYNNLKEKRAKALKFRDANDSIVDVIEGRSRITTTDMQDAIDMAKPDILETIAGIDEPLKLDPDEAKWVGPVKKLQVLGNVMVKRKNKWFRVCSDFLDDSMILQFGCIKYRWVEEKKNTEKTYEGLEDLEIQAILQKEGTSLVEDMISEESKRITKINYSLTDEYVRYDVVPAERIKFPLDTRDFAECPMVIEEVRLYEHEFIKTYGKKFFNKVKEARDALDKATPDMEFDKRFKHLGGIDHLYDKKGDKYKAYECYFWEDDKPWTMTWVGDEVAPDLDIENKYGKPPYRGGSPFLIAHALIGKGYLDLLENIMRERTYLKRQIHDIITQNNFRRYFVDVEGSGMNINDYENNSAMNGLVRCNGPVDATHISPEEKIPLGQDVMAFWEMLQNEKDSHIPTPRAFSGLEGAKDERTYRGKQLKVNQASKKLLMMLRGYMEDVFGPLFQDTLDCIAKFMKRKTVVRYLNEDYDIDPSDIICKYALIVNVGLGAHDKQDLIVKLQQLIGLALQEMAIPGGIITAQNLYYMNSELVKAMGFLNTMDFVTDPKLKESVMQLVQMLQALMQYIPPEAHEFVAQAIQQVMNAAGIQPPQQGKGGENAQGTQPGDQPAEIPAQPENTFNPQTEVTGGGFYA